MKAAAFRRTKGSFRRTGWPKSTAMTRPLSLHGHYPASSLLRGSPPLSGASVLSASRLQPLAPFPWHHRPGSHVPYKSLFEVRAAYMPDAARPVSGHLPSSSRRQCQPPVLTSSKQVSTLHRRFACARLPRTCLPGSSSRRFRDAHHHGFWPQQLAVTWDQRPDRRTRRALLHLRYSCAPPCGPAMLVTQGTSLPFSCVSSFVSYEGYFCRAAAAAGQASLDPFRASASFNEAAGGSHGRERQSSRQSRRSSACSR